ncbi:hypothetical protein D3C86_1233670 [compost metagenome]
MPRRAASRVTVRCLLKSPPQPGLPMSRRANVRPPVLGSYCTTSALALITALCRWRCRTRHWHMTASFPKGNCHRVTSFQVFIYAPRARRKTQVMTSSGAFSSRPWQCIRYWQGRGSAMITDRFIFLVPMVLCCNLKKSTTHQGYHPTRPVSRRVPKALLARLNRRMPTCVISACAPSLWAITSSAWSRPGDWRFWYPVIAGRRGMWRDTGNRVIRACPSRSSGAGNPNCPWGRYSIIPTMLPATFSGAREAPTRR